VRDILGFTPLPLGIVLEILQQFNFLLLKCLPILGLLELLLEFLFCDADALQRSFYLFKLLGECFGVLLSIEHLLLDMPWNSLLDAVQFEFELRLLRVQTIALFQHPLAGLPKRIVFLLQLLNLLGEEIAFECQLVPRRHSCITLLPVASFVLLQLLIPAVDFLQVDLQPLQLVVDLQELCFGMVEQSLGLLRVSAVLLLVALIFCAQNCHLIGEFRRADVHRILAMRHELNVGVLHLQQLLPKILNGFVTLARLLGELFNSVGLDR